MVNPFLLNFGAELKATRKPIKIMKKKIGTMALMLGLALSASAQIELMFHYYSDGEYSHYTVMDRTKKLYWMDDDDNTCFKITNYKKSGNTETFTLEAKEKGGMGRDRCAVTTTVDANGHTATIQYKEPYFFGGKKYDIRITAEEPYEQERITRYFNQLAGYPADEGIVKGASVTPSVSNAPQNPVDNAPQNPVDNASQNPVDKAKGTAKQAVGKVKGLFKKK